MKADFAMDKYRLTLKSLNLLGLIILSKPESINLWITPRIWGVAHIAGIRRFDNPTRVGLWLPWLPVA